MSGRARAVLRRALDLLTAYQLHEWSFGFNRRKREMGTCFFDCRRIELSLYFVEMNDDSAIDDTLLHELAHALVGPGHGHDRVWRDMCERVGAKPERLCNEARMPDGRWQAVCGGCGMVHHRHRKPKRMIGWYCRKCGVERGQLIWKCAG